MVPKRIARMNSQHHYRTTYYSKSEAAAIVRRNEQRMTDEARRICKARRAANDMREAIQLGLTIENYLKLVV